MKPNNFLVKFLLILWMMMVVPATLSAYIYNMYIDNATSVTEGDQAGEKNMLFNVRIGDLAPAGGVGFTYTIVGSGSFSTITGSGTILYNQSSATITVPLPGDLIVEATETLTATIASTGNNIPDPTATGTVLDNDTRSLTINSPSEITEGSNAVFTVTLTDNTASVDLPFTFTTTGSTVTLTNDYTVSSYGGTIPVNQSSTTITIPTVDDSDVEGSETLKINLVSTNPPLGTLNSGTITINDNDLYGITIASDANNSVAEGNVSSRNATYKVTINQAHTADITVHWALSGGATNPADAADFVSGLIFGDLTFTSGQTEQIITIPIQGDTDAEQNEQYTITLSGQSANASLINTSVNGTINNDDSGTVTISSNSSTVDEGSSVTYTVKLSFVPTSAVSVNYSVTNKGTTSGSDHNGGTSGSVNFTAGDDTETFTITATNDTDEEAAESFDVNLTSATGATITSPSGVSTTINASDGRTLSISPLTGTATTEGNTTNPTVSYTVKLSGKPLNNVKVNYALTHTTTDDADFLFTTYPKTGSVIFTATDYSDKPITFQIHGDTDAEPNQTYKITITSADANATVESGKGEATGTITNDDNPVVYFDPLSYTITEGNSGTKDQTVTVKLSGPTSSAVTFDIKTINGTATSAADDFTAITSSSINSIKRRTINAGDTNTTFTVKIEGDTNPESTESFSVGIYNLSTGNATISPTDGNATITITDNDLAKVQIATLTTSSVVEGNSGTTYADFNVTIDKSPSSNVDVNYSVTGAAVNGTDFVGGVLPTNKTVSFTAGTTTLYKVIQIPIQGDTTLEGNENFTVTLNSASGGATLGTTKTAIGTILNDDTNVSAITDQTVAEPPCPTDTTTADLTVTLAQAVNYPVKIYYQTQDVTAKAGSDYTSANNSILINSGTTGHIYITIRGDTNNTEGFETFKVNLTSAEDNLGNPIAITDANATVTITDNLDYNITGFIGGSVVEGDVNGTQHIAFTIDYCKPLTVAKILSIAYSMTTATQNVDYNATLASITIPAHLTNTSYTFDIPVYGDLITEVPDETFDLTLSGTNVNLTDNTARGTIIDDDDRTIDINSTSVIEGNTGNTTATLRIHMSKAAGAPVRVNYSTLDGSATTGDSDYTARSYYVDFAANDATDKYVDFNVTGDYTVEGNETFSVNISNNSGITMSNTSGTITILDDDNGTLTLGGTTTYIEGNVDQDINLTVTFSGSPVARTIYYYTTAGSASVGSDFVNVPNTTAVVIPISTTPITVNLPITLKGDLLYEPLDENFTVTITSPNGFAIVNSPMVIHITDDDGNLSISNPAAVLEGDNTDKNVTFSVTLSRAMSIPITVNYATSDWEATAPDDYTAIPSTTLIFTPGQPLTQDINVTIKGDTLYEPGNQRFKNTITSPQGLTLTNAGVGIGSIIDDDNRTVIISTASFKETEGNISRDFNITLSSPMVEDLNLTYTTVAGTAFAGSDYNATSGSILIPKTVTKVTVPVTILGDFTSEGNENFTLSVSTLKTGITFSGGTMTILNDDGNLSIVSTVDRNETNTSSFLMPFRVTLSSPASASTIYVNYATIDGTAISTGVNKDFDATSGTLTFAPGQTYQDINVTVYGDNVIEGDEYFDLNITNTQGVTITNATSRGNILDDDGRVISVVNKSVSEGDQGTITSYVTLHLSEISGSDANVSYTLSSTSATAGVDYNATGGSASIPNGIQDITIPIQHYGDLRFEQDENITITISSLTAGFTTPIATGILTLANDDGVLTIGNTSIQEGNVSTVTTGSILVTLSRVSTLPIDINVSTINNTATAGADYNAIVSQIFTIDANTTTVSIPLEVLGDNLNEGSEYFTVRITNDQNVTIDDGDGNVTITDSYINDMTTYPQYQRDFTRRFYVNTYGNFVATGAPIMCAQVSDTNTSCDWDHDGFLATATTKFLNDDTNTSVKNSSSATLNITMETGDKILWAGLYWQGHVESTNPDGLDSNISGWNTIQFKTPNGIVTPKTADLGDRNATNMYYFKTSTGAQQPGFRFFYQGFVDVTNEVNASLTSNTGTTFTVGGMTASVGADHDINDPSHILLAGPPIVYGSGNVGHFGGWSLVVVREKADKTNPDDLHNISIFYGYKYLVAGASNPVSSIDINVSGFRTPKSLASGQPIDSQLLYFGGGSEKKIANDELSITNKSGIFSTVSDANNPANNPLNDTIGVNGINIDSTRIYNPGIDLDSIQVGEHLETNQSSTTIRLTANYAGAGSDQAFAGLIGFSTQLYQPQLCYDFTFQQNGVHLKNVVGERDIPTIQGRVIQNDPITAGIYLKNVDSDFQIYGLSLFTDMNASKIHYSSPSARVSRVNGVTYGSVLSENTGSCDYESGSATQQACHNDPNVRIGLGNNATGWSHDTAGSLNSGDFVFGQFDLNPDGMSGDVNESIKLQVSYYIDFENEDGTASFASYPSNKLGQNVKPPVPCCAWRPPGLPG